MKKILSITFIAIILAALFVPAASAAREDLLWDNAGLLTDEEFSEVSAALTEVSNKYDIDVAVFNTIDFEEYCEDAYGETAFNASGAASLIGQNELGYDCILFFQSTSERDWYIWSNHRGYEAVNSYGAEYIGEDVKRFLKNDEYKDAYLTFAADVDLFLAEYEKGTPYSESHKPFNWADFIKSAGISLVIGLIIGALALLSLKKKYKPVRLKAEANDYLVPGSLNLRQSYDHFLYTHVSRTRRSDKGSSSSSGGGSSGGAGGKY